MGESENNHMSPENPTKIKQPTKLRKRENSESSCNRAIAHTHFVGCYILKLVHLPQPLLTDVHAAPYLISEMHCCYWKKTTNIMP